MGADEDILERQLFPEQLSDESQREEFVCKVCEMVLEAPIMTKCSHLVCGHCFRGWVQRQREIAQRKSQPLDVVPCPVCNTPLKKADADPLQERAQDEGACKMLWRMFNELSVQCIFHASVAAEAPQGVTDQATEAMRCGLQCTWVGGRDAYANHKKECVVIKSLAGGAAPGGAAPGSVAPSSAQAVRPAPPPVPPGPSRPEAVVEATEIVYGDFPGNGDPSVMTLTEGEYVEVLYTDPSGWSYGRVRNAKPAREGWFPRKWTFPTGHGEASVVKTPVAPVEAPAPAAPSSSVKTVRAYAARNPQEHSVDQHETVEMVRHENAWALISKCDPGAKQARMGWVPAWAVGL